MEKWKNDKFLEIVLHILHLALENCQTWIKLVWNQSHPASLYLYLFSICIRFASELNKIANLNQIGLEPSHLVSF